MRLLLLMALFILWSSLSAQISMKIDPAAHLYLGDGSLLFLENVTVNNTGTISSSSDSKVIQKGNTSVDFGGTGTTGIAILRLDKSESSEVNLTGDVSILDSIHFVAGKLHLDGHTIFLGSDALLLNESNDHRIYGSTGSIEITKVLDAPGSINPGNLGLTLATFDMLGSTRIVRSHTEQTADDLPSNRSILRYYEVFPTTNTGLEVDLRYLYFEDELGSIPESELTMWRSDNSGSSWYQLGFSSRDAAANFVEIENLSSLSRYTLSSATPLPVVLTAFWGDCEEGQVDLYWQSEMEEDNDFFSIEYSTDGRRWETMAEVAGSADGHFEREYHWQSDRPLSGHFRLSQTDFDGSSEIVSPTLTLACRTDFNWSLYPNPMRDRGFIKLQLPDDARVSFVLINSLGQRIRSIEDGFFLAGEYLLDWQAAVPAGIYQLQATVGNQRWAMPIVVVD